MGKTWETACGLSTSHVFFNAHPETWGRWTCFVMLRNMFQIGDDPPTSIGHKDSTRPSNQQPKGQAALREDKRMAWQVMRCQRGSITSHPNPTPSNAASSHAEVQHDHTLHHSGWYSPQRWQVETVEITSWSLGGQCQVLREDSDTKTLEVHTYGGGKIVWAQLLPKMKLRTSDRNSIDS